MDELSRAASAGDARAFGELHARYSAGLIRLFLKRTRGRDDLAEELAQRTWTLAWEAIRLGKYDPGRATLSTFVYAVGNNVWLQHLRKAGRSKEQSGAGMEGPWFEHDDEPHAVDAEAIQGVRDALREPEGVAVHAVLSESERELVRWAASGLSDRDLARKLGLAPSTVNVKKRSAYEKIRRFLAQRGIRGLGEDGAGENTSSPGERRPGEAE